MEFRTKWELLEYLGQDKKYVRLIDRMIVKGEVKVDRWWYIYEKPEDEEIKKLKNTVEELKNTVKILRDDNIRLTNEKVELEEMLWSKEDTAIIDKIYEYMTKVLHLRVDYSDYKEFVEWI